MAKMNLNYSPVAPAISLVPPGTIAAAREPPGAPPGSSHLQPAIGPLGTRPPLDFAALLLQGGAGRAIRKSLSTPGITRACSPSTSPATAANRERLECFPLA
jgi:hypothetical protein